MNADKEQPGKMETDEIIKLKETGKRQPRNCKEITRFRKKDFG